MSTDKFCSKNKAIICKMEDSDSPDCEHCGWNPDVTSRRVEKIEAKLQEEAKKNKKKSKARYHA